MLLPTSLVGSYPQPEWLIDREKLSKQVPRVRADDLWLVAPDKLEAAQDDATILAIRDQERAGLDIITDGEQRRESYSNRFATALDGIDIEKPGIVINRNGRPIPVPRIVGPIHRRQPVELARPQGVCAPTPTARSRQRCRARSPWAARRKTTITATRRPWRWHTPMRSMPRSRTSLPPAPTWCRSMNLGCSSIRIRRAATA